MIEPIKINGILNLVLKKKDVVKLVLQLKQLIDKEATPDYYPHGKDDDGNVKYSQGGWNHPSVELETELLKIIFWKVDQ